MQLLVIMLSLPWLAYPTEYNKIRRKPFIA